MKSSLSLLLMTCVLGGVLNAAEPLALKGHRFLTLNTVIRVNQIESARNLNVGKDEAAIHTPETVAAFRDAVAKGFPGAKVTWAFGSDWSQQGTPKNNWNAANRLVS